MQKKYIPGEGEENTKNRRSTRREPGKIKRFFRRVFDKYISDEETIKDVELRFGQFREYVQIVSNGEIDLIDGGNDEDIRAHVKYLWNKLAKEFQEIEKA